jgi:hypothetical protein
MKIKVQNARLAFPKLFVAKAVADGDEPNFGASLILDPSDPGNAKTIAEIDKAIDQVAKEKWGAKTDTIIKLARKTDKVCLHDGDLKAQYAGFEGMRYVSANNKMRPVVVNKDTSPLTAQDGVVYAGCYVNATIELWAQDNKYGRRVNATLLGVQFVRDGDHFAGGSTGSADDFDDLGEGADEDSLV